MERNIDKRSSDASKTEDHKNEGFLKSIWHNLTNHPAHQKDNNTEGQTGSTTNADAEKKPDDKKE